MIQVFHNPNYMEIVSGQYIPTSIPRDIILVAQVDSNNMTEAYLLTQHTDKSWATSPRVNVIKESRSTRVGDFMQDAYGAIYLVLQDKFKVIKDVKLR